MQNNDFVACIGSYKVHDSKVEKIINSGNEVTVLLKSQEGEIISVRLSNVQEVIEKRSVGMILYAICEIKDIAPYRKFVFVNTDEEDGASLIVVAREYHIE
ncbi:hypothetical protein [Clostridium sp. JNZ J1-5]